MESMHGHKKIPNGAIACANGDGQHEQTKTVYTWAGSFLSTSILLPAGDWMSRACGGLSVVLM